MPSRSAALLLLLALAGLWVGAKVTLFEHLAYTSDLFSFVEISNSVLRGRPATYENSFGLHRNIHNTYTVLLLAPLTHLWGALGLFAGTAALFLLAWMAAARAGPGPPMERWTAAAALLLGPVAFWIWDDPVYGWHSEILYLPLAVLFALSLQRGSRWSWLWAALLVLNREEGPIVACGVHLLWILNGDPAASHRWRRAVRVVLGWTAVFLLGVLWLRFLQAGLPYSRLAHALDGLPRLWELRATLAVDARRWLGIVGIGLLPLAAAGAWRRIGWVLAVTLPLLALAVIGSAPYAYHPILLTQHGPLWTVRLAGVWSLIAAGLLLRRPGQTEQTEQGGSWMWGLACALSIVLQYDWLEKARGYRLSDRVIPGRVAAQEPARLLRPAEKRFLFCLQDRLPVLTGIASDGSLFRYFHRHEIIWPDRPENAWTPLGLVVCDHEKRLPFTSSACDLLRDRFRARGLRELAVEGITVAAEAPFAPVVAACVRVSGAHNRL